MFASHRLFLFCLLFLPTIESFLINPIPTNDGNVSCYVNDRLNISYRLCAIVEYTGIDGNSGTKQFKYGLWGMNAFRRFINERDCVGFTAMRDIGYGYCYHKSYELSTNVSLCICSTNECNENLDFCKRMVDESTLNSSLLPLTEILSTPLQCSNRSDFSFSCPTSPFVNQTLCQNYVRQNSLLCGAGGPIGSVALMAENYDLYLDQMFYRLRPIDQTFFLNYTQYNLFIRKTISSGVQIDECLCFEVSSCNENLSICAPQIVRTVVTTTIRSSSSGSVEHEKGLGGSATAGIVCGIVIFSMIIVIEMIVLRRI